MPSVWILPLGVQYDSLHPAPVSALRGMLAAFHLVLTWITVSTRKQIHLTGAWNVVYTVFCVVTSILLGSCLMVGFQLLRSAGETYDFVLVAFVALAVFLSFVVACFLWPQTRHDASKHRVDDPVSLKLSSNFRLRDALPDALSSEGSLSNDRKVSSDSDEVGVAAPDGVEPWAPSLPPGGSLSNASSVGDEEEIAPPHAMKPLTASWSPAARVARL